MARRKDIARIAAGIVLAALTAAPAYGAAGRPPEMSPQEYRATLVRSGALNALYGLEKPRGMSHAEYRASLIRSTALNERYGLPVGLTPDAITRLYGVRVVESTPTGTPAVPVVAAAQGFDWTDAAIGAGVVAGLVLIGAGGAVAVRRHDHFSRLHHR